MCEMCLYFTGIHLCLLCRAIADTLYNKKKYIFFLVVFHKCAPLPLEIKVE